MRRHSRADGLCAECRARRLGGRSVANDDLRRSGERLGGRREAEEMRRPVRCRLRPRRLRARRRQARRHPRLRLRRPAPIRSTGPTPPRRTTDRTGSRSRSPGRAAPATSPTSRTARPRGRHVRPDPEPAVQLEPAEPDDPDRRGHARRRSGHALLSAGAAERHLEPRQSGTAVAHQQYQFRCTGPGCSGNWEDFPGQAYTITREVYPQFVRLNPWRYRITKDGVGNLFHYSREVAVPEPPAAPPPPPPVGP